MHNNKLFFFGSRYAQPLRFQVGDTLHITCDYKSTNKDKYTYYGDGASDEMCFGFIIYYPVVPALKYCLSYDGEHKCVNILIYMFVILYIRFKKKKTKDL